MGEGNLKMAHHRLVNVEKPHNTHTHTHARMHARVNEELNKNVSVNI